MSEIYCASKGVISKQTWTSLHHSLLDLTRWTHAPCLIAAYLLREETILYKVENSITVSTCSQLWKLNTAVLFNVWFIVIMKDDFWFNIIEITCTNYIKYNNCNITSKYKKWCIFCRKSSPPKFRKTLISRWIDIILWIYTYTTSSRHLHR